MKTIITLGFLMGSLIFMKIVLVHNLKKDKIKPRLLQSIKIKKLENIASNKLIKNVNKIANYIKKISPIKN